MRRNLIFGDFLYEIYILYCSDSFLIALGRKYVKNCSAKSWELFYGTSK